MSGRGDRTAQLLAHVFQERRHVRWQWGRERAPFPTLRVLKADLLGVQSLARASYTIIRRGKSGCVALTKKSVAIMELVTACVLLPLG